VPKPEDGRLSVTRTDDPDVVVETSIAERDDFRAIPFCCVSELLAEG